MKKLQDAARMYLGSKFVHQGRSAAGMDCVGLVVLAARDLGIALADFTTYSMRPSPVKLVEHLSACCYQVGEAQTGDILAFAFIGPTFPQHVAIKTDRGLIHSLREARKVVETSYDEHWSSKLSSIWRIK